jgi:hypothetical protein
MEVAIPYALRARRVVYFSTGFATITDPVFQLFVKTEPGIL